MFRSGTSIGANAIEAQNAESKADFIDKMKAASKEADETQYWMMLCDYAQNYPQCKELIMNWRKFKKCFQRYCQLQEGRTLLVIC